MIEGTHSTCDNGDFERNWKFDNYVTQGLLTLEKWPAQPSSTCPTGPDLVYRILFTPEGQKYVLGHNETVNFGMNGAAVLECQLDLGEITAIENNGDHTEARVEYTLKRVRPTPFAREECRTGQVLQREQWFRRSDVGWRAVN
ncbi:MAG: hypothetical protein JWO97_3866 [Acidobacteria bacterium]|nr:hypothetical protein [Acidobacteriota bacterium]